MRPAIIIMAKFGTAHDRPAPADAGYTTPGPNMNECLKLGSDEDSANDRFWVKLLRRDSIGLSNLPVMNLVPAAWSNPE
jgi:hypothetical protein